MVLFVCFFIRFDLNNYLFFFLGRDILRALERGRNCADK